ncbi:MAG: hypothetical protein P1Q69_12120 [Candidatus Thorarchaeota archaeon]|nr:hypothetical protein [Candidatus Thorarchaeota archaeon]
MYKHKGNQSRVRGVLISLILLLTVILVQWGWRIIPDIVFELAVVFFLACVVCFGCCLKSAEAKDIAEFPTTL